MAHFAYALEVNRYAFAMTDDRGTSADTHARATNIQDGVLGGIVSGLIVAAGSWAWRLVEAEVDQGNASRLTWVSILGFIAVVAVYGIGVHRHQKARLTWFAGWSACFIIIALSMGFAFFYSFDPRFQS